MFWLFREYFYAILTDMCSLFLQIEVKLHNAKTEIWNAKKEVYMICL